MNLHPVLLEKLNLAVSVQEMPAMTTRDARLASLHGKAQAVIGMRRTGKTTFLLQLQREWRAAAPHESVIFIGFDDDRLSDLTLDQLSLLLEEYFRRFPRFRSELTVRWLMDEIQAVEGWERFVRRVLDTERMDVVVSGSSARLLSREVHTSLRGRGMETIIRPFSFREFLRHRGAEPAGRVMELPPKDRSELEQRFLEYLSVGGFPEAQNASAGERLYLLQGYVDVVLFRDIIERFNVTQVSALRWLTRQCLRNPGGLFSVHRLARDLSSQGLGIAKDTLHAFVGHLEDVFLIRTIAIDTESERKRNTNPRKAYPVDTGLIRAFDHSGRSNIGHALETAVLHELDRRNASTGYVKTAEGFEVDFIARILGTSEELIQVCAGFETVDILLRELRALQEAGREYPRARKRLLTLLHDQIPPSLPEGILAQPAYAWMLDDPT